MMLRGLAALLLLGVSLPAQVKRILWRDPGPIDTLDFAGSLSPEIHDPKPPFEFLREDLSGTQLKLFAKDANGIEWNVKFGNEIKPESFCWRIVKAMGYFAEPIFYVPGGRIENMGPLQRHEGSLAPNGHFTEARFQYRYPDLKFVDSRSWAWGSNPFVGTKELSGLKLLLILFSNYDNKDATAGAGGPNTAIFQHSAAAKNQEWIYTFIDWGSSMGSWGDLTGATNWRCDLFEAQSKDFIQGASKDGSIEFGYVGHVPGFNDGIRAEHAGWFLGYLKRISEAQWRDALRAAGANPTEQDRYLKALQVRIAALDSVAR